MYWVMKWNKDFQKWLCAEKYPYYQLEEAKARLAKFRRDFPGPWPQHRWTIMKEVEEA